MNIFMYAYLCCDYSQFMNSFFIILCFYLYHWWLKILIELELREKKLSRWIHNVYVCTIWFWFSWLRFFFFCYSCVLFAFPIIKITLFHWFSHFFIIMIFFVYVYRCDIEIAMWIKLWHQMKIKKVKREKVWLKFTEKETLWGRNKSDMSLVDV
jgi:hypothetical protein